MSKDAINLTPWSNAHYINFELFTCTDLHFQFPFSNLWYSIKPSLNVNLLGKGLPCQTSLNSLIHAALNSWEESGDEATKYLPAGISELAPSPAFL